MQCTFSVKRKLPTIKDELATVVGIPLTPKVYAAPPSDKASKFRILTPTLNKIDKKCLLEICREAVI